jgi:hypothetical protein
MPEGLDNAALVDTSLEPMIFIESAPSLAALFFASIIASLKSSPNSAPMLPDPITISIILQSFEVSTIFNFLASGVASGMDWIAQDVKTKQRNVINIVFMQSPNI